jgi:NAD(P)-dependent dehydrogenase (short-subunit alcohol dehydrogenase family)
VLPTLRSQGAGRIINTGSSAGFAASAGRGLYGASKSAVETITEALHAELTPLGIHATVVEPGSFRTEFLTTDSRRVPVERIPAYADTTGQLLDAVQAGCGHQPGDPVQAVAAIRRLAAAAEPPLRLQLGSDCVDLVEGKLASVAKELDQRRELALSTDFKPAKPAPGRASSQRSISLAGPVPAI